MHPAARRPADACFGLELMVMGTSSSPPPLAGEVARRSPKGEGGAGGGSSFASPPPQPSPASGGGSERQRAGRGERKQDARQRLLARLRSAAPHRVRLAVSMLYRGRDRARLQHLSALAREAHVPLIAVDDVLYHASRPARAPGRAHLRPRAHDARDRGPPARSQRRASPQASRRNGAAVCATCRRPVDGNLALSANATGSRSKNCATNIPTRRVKVSPRRSTRSSL